MLSYLKELRSESRWHSCWACSGADAEIGTEGSFTEGMGEKTRKGYVELRILSSLC